MTNKKDPRKNELVDISLNVNDIKGSVDVLNSIPVIKEDASGAYYTIDNSSIYINLVSSPNGDSQYSGTDLTPVTFKLGLNSGSPFVNFDFDATVLFEEATDKLEPLNEYGAPKRQGLSTSGKYTGNVPTYKLPLNQNLLSLKRSGQEPSSVVNPISINEGITINNSYALAFSNPDYLQLSNPGVSASEQSGTLYFTTPIQPLWWSEANWELTSGSNEGHAYSEGRIRRATTLGYLPSQGITQYVPDMHIFSEGNPVPEINDGNQANKFASLGAIRDLSETQTLGKHFRPDSTLTTEIFNDSSVSLINTLSIEDSGKIINSPKTRLITINNDLSNIFNTSNSEIVSEVQVINQQYFDQSSFHNFLLCSGTTEGVPDAVRYGFRFNSIASGAKYDYGMRRIASSHERLGHTNQMFSNRNIIGEGVEKDNFPWPAYTIHNYYSPVHFYSLGGNKYKNRRTVSFGAPYTRIGNTGIVETSRQFSSHIDISPTYQETNRQSPGYFSLGIIIYPNENTTAYDANRSVANILPLSFAEDMPYFYLTPENYNPSNWFTSMSYNKNFYNFGFGYVTLVELIDNGDITTATNNLSVYSDSFVDQRLILRDKPEDVDIAPQLEVYKSSMTSREFASSSLDHVMRILNPVNFGSTTKSTYELSKRESLKYYNLQRFYFIDTEFGKEFPLRLYDSNLGAGSSELDPDEMSIALVSASYADFNNFNGIGGHYYSKPQADSFRFIPSSFHSSWGGIDSGDPAPWNIHGTEINFQTFVKRNHLYSLNNNQDTIAGFTYTKSDYTDKLIDYSIGTITLTNIYDNRDLSVEKNTVSISNVLAGMAIGLPDTSSFDGNRNVGITYALGEFGVPALDSRFQFPSRGFEYFTTSSYYSNNISSEPKHGFMGMSTAGFDIPFSGSRDISVDVWVQFEPVITTEINRIT